MKRIPAIALTIVTLLTALTGCMASQNPSEKDGEQDPSEKRLPITMTIAETLPSCETFEYRESNTPYCFYAYDTQGKLYRVFWTNFTDLNEKDLIVVEYNNSIKELTYDEYPSGWTPQYEITAISIKKKNDPYISSVDHIQIKSGVNTVYPFGCLLWSRVDNTDGTYYETNVDKYDVIDFVSGKTNISATDIPEIVMDESVSYTEQVNCLVENVYLITADGDKYTKRETTFDDLSSLADGRYFVVLEVLLSANCDPDVPQNYYRYEDVFCLVVEKNNQSDTSGSITISVEKAV